MARRLKTYQTSIGFFDLAIAAPSMKAAAEAWSTQTDIFKKGFAKETHDAAIVEATMARPGVVLKRPVGSNESFRENAELPHLLNIERVKERQAEPRRVRSEKPLPHKTDHKTAKAAALAFEREQKRREAARQKEEVARARKRKQQEQAIAKAERALKNAEQEHDTKVKKIEQDKAALDQRSQAEDARWEKQKQKLESALRRTRY